MSKYIEDELTLALNQRDTHALAQCVLTLLIGVESFLRQSSLAASGLVIKLEGTGNADLVRDAKSHVDQLVCNAGTVSGLSNDIRHALANLTKQPEN